MASGSIIIGLAMLGLAVGMDINEIRIIWDSVESEIFDLPDLQGCG